MAPIAAISSSDFDIIAQIANNINECIDEKN